MAENYSGSELSSLITQLFCPCSVPESLALLLRDELFFLFSFQSTSELDVGEDPSLGGFTVLVSFFPLMLAWIPRFSHVFPSQS